MSISLESKLKKYLKDIEIMKAPSCLETETIGLYIEGKLPKGEKMRVENHISSCLYCLDQLTELKELIYFQSKRAPLSTDLLKKIREFYPKEEGSTLKSIGDLIASYIQGIGSFLALPFRQWRYTMACAITASLVVLVTVILLKPGQEIPVIAKKEGLKTEIAMKEERGAPPYGAAYKIDVAREYAPPSSGDIVRMLTKNTDVKSLSGSIKEGHETTYGFSGSISLEKASFRIGVYLTDLEVSLRAEDKANSLTINKKLISSLQSIEGPKDLISSYSDISKKIEEGTSPTQFSGKIQMVVSFLKDKNVLLYLRFGEWVEGGRLASSVKDREFFDIKSNDYFIKTLEGKGVPQRVLTALDEVKSTLVKDKITDKDFRQLDRAFTDIVGMM